MRIIVLFFLVLFMAACGGDTEIEVIPEPEVVEPEPEPVEEAIPEPEPEPEKYYSFLESWGDEDGRISCSDSLLGPEANFPSTGVGTEPTNEPTLVAGSGPTCSTVLFNSINVFDWDIDGSDEIVHPSASLVMIKTFVGGSRFNREPVPRTTTSVIGGKVYGEFNFTGGSKEVDDRDRLYRNCRVGTDPRDGLKGDWQAIKKVTTSINNEKNTVIEVCFRFDSLPGAVKCFVTKYEGTDPNVNDTVEDSVVLYAPDETKLDVEIISVSATAMTLFDEQNRQSDFPNRDRLCNLFDEGAWKRNV